MRNQMCFTSFVLIALGTAFSLACVAGDQPSAPDRWPGFLGAGSSPLVPETLPLEWSPESPNVSWKTELTGTGQSSPVIWGDMVFVTSIDGTMKEDCHITAICLADGKVRWDHKTNSAQPVRSNYFQSRSAPTPAVDKDGVYAFFETGKLVAISHEGEKRWERNLVEDYGEFEVRIGLAASVAQTDDTVFVLVDHEGPSYLLAVDKQSGENKWQTERFSRSSYSSPVVLKIAGEPQVVVSSSGSVDGYDPETGEQLWTMEEVGGNRATSPLAFGNDRFLISASPGMHDEQLEDARESNFAMQVERTAEGFETKVLWKANKAMPAFASPIVHNGLAYWINNVGVVYCFDAETGDAVYTKRSGQLCWATPLAVDDRIYLFGKDGLTTVIAAGPEFKILAKNELLEGATEAGEADIRRREARKHQQSTENSQPTAEADGETARRGGPPTGRPNGGNSAANSSDTDNAPSIGEGRSFAEAVQYGYAAVNGSLVIRTGGHVYCLRSNHRVQNEKGEVK